MANALKPRQVYGENGTAVSGTTVYDSEVWTPGENRRCVVQFRGVGTQTGTLILQGSNSTAKEIAAGTDRWVTIDAGHIGPAIPAINANQDFYTLFLQQIPFNRVRLRYTNATNSGVIHAWIMLG